MHVCSRIVKVVSTKSIVIISSKDWDTLVSIMGQCSNNEDHHTFIDLQLKDYNSKLEQNMTLCECLRRCTGICNESRVTCMKNYAWWPSHEYDVNYMIMHGNMTMMKCVITNGTMEIAWKYISEWLWK